jgi:hypothetical protein
MMNEVLLSILAGTAKKQNINIGTWKAGED